MSARDDNSPLGQIFLAWLDTVGNFYDPDLLAYMKTLAGNSPTPAQVEIAFQLLAGWQGTGMKVPQPAVAPPLLYFPLDHGEHPDTSIEWRYFTTCLDLDDGSTVNVIGNFFRKAIATQATAAPPLTGLDRQLYSTSIAWTRTYADGTPGEHHVFPNEVYAPIQDIENVSVSNWPFAMRIGANALTSQGDADVFPLHIQLNDPGGEGRPSLSLDIVCEATNPLFLQGYYGYVGQPPTSPNPMPGGPDLADKATYYYSWAQQRTAGTVVIDGDSHKASGQTWMDHQWGGGRPPETNAPPPWDGWIWFEFQFDHNRSVTCSAIHGPVVDHRLPPQNSGFGTYVDGDYSQPVTATIEVLDYVQSPDTDARYPSDWILRIQNLRASETDRLTLDLIVKPQTVLRNQILWEASHCTEYSEAACTVTAAGFIGLEAVVMNGVGYCEGDAFETPSEAIVRCKAMIGYPGP